MKKISFSASFFILAAIMFYACKEEEISTQQFVQNHIIGKWALKKTVLITKENGVETKNDTIFYGRDTTSLPIDSVHFLADGSCIKKGEKIGYTVDGEGKNITYNKDSIGTWFIQHLRLSSIYLTQEKTEKKGSTTFLYYKEDQLIK